MTTTTRATINTIVSRVVVSLAVAAIIAGMTYLARLDSRVDALDVRLEANQQGASDMRDDIKVIRDDVREIRDHLLGSRK